MEGISLFASIGVHLSLPGFFHCTVWCSVKVLFTVGTSFLQLGKLGGGGGCFWTGIVTGLLARQTEMGVKALNSSSKLCGTDRAVVMIIRTKQIAFEKQRNQSTKFKEQARCDNSWWIIKVDTKMQTPIIPDLMLLRTCLSLSVNG